MKLVRRTCTSVNECTNLYSIHPAAYCPSLNLGTSTEHHNLCTRYSTIGLNIADVLCRQGYPDAILGCHWRAPKLGIAVHSKSEKFRRGLLTGGVFALLLQIVDGLPNARLQNSARLSYAGIPSCFISCSAYYFSDRGLRARG